MTLKILHSHLKQYSFEPEKSHLVLEVSRNWKLLRATGWLNLNKFVVKRLILNEDPLSPFPYFNIEGKQVMYIVYL